MNWIVLHWIELLGYLASASVLAAFCMSAMVPLRMVAIGSNFFFMAYGAVAHIYPVLLLHVILLPVNFARLIQMLRLIRSVKAAKSPESSIEPLLPFMSRRLFKAGQVVMNKDDTADCMYYLAEGTLEIREFGKTLRSGEVLGEIGIFSPERKRMATVVCATDCELFELTESRAKQLYFQDRSFGIAMLQLIINRLLEDVRLGQVAAGATGRGALAAAV